MFVEFFSSEKFVSILNTTFIGLIPKKVGLRILNISGLGITFFGQIMERLRVYIGLIGWKFVVRSSKVA